MTFLYVITIVIAFTLIIVIHELGHFIAGKLFNFRIEVFSIGMGKRMWGITRGETDYRISMIPVGGFVAFGGISDTEGPAETGDPRDMPNRPVWQRMIVIFAGPLMNLVSGLILAVIIFAIGAQFTSAQIGAVNPASPAAVAGIKV
ncbi:MAG: site-2 protease family protein, partial [Candidatus Brocadiia bacterium]